MKIKLTPIAVAGCLLLFTACNSIPKPGPRPDIKAFRVQNDKTLKQVEDTKKHVVKFSESNRKVQEQATQESDALDKVISKLKGLLGQP